MTDETQKSKMLYVVITVDDYIPNVQLVTNNKIDALREAKTLAEGWNNETTTESGELYFNQKEDGNMEYAVSVQEYAIESEQNCPDCGTKMWQTGWGTRKEVYNCPGCRAAVTIIHGPMFQEAK
jgi:formamidopyrimidine-DNA glycosylase